MGAVLNLANVDGERRRRLREQALAPDILLGMPHLTPFGLSETWLMKELAHRHWLLLGAELGLDDADFRDADGNEVYAAISASRLIGGAGLATLRANDILTISGSMTPLDRASSYSSHVLSRSGMRLAEIQLLSTFVRRTEPGRNASISRLRLRTGASVPASNALLDFARDTRRASPAVPPAEAAFPPYRHLPLPGLEFNGAGLLYFAHYPDIADRALSHWLQRDIRVIERTIVFTGNIDSGEAVHATLSPHHDSQAPLTLNLHDTAGRLLAIQHLLLAD